MRAPIVLALILLAVARPAFADLTGFVGLTTNPSSRLARGVAAGIMLVIVGFEFEYSSTSEDEAELAPGLRTGMGNLVVQTPFPIGGLQFYGTAGGGIYREEFLEETETSVAANVGGGVRVSLAGPLKLRLDYRLFRLQGEPLHSRYHRVYAGLNLLF
jgi:hypothetical protein